MIGTLLLYIFLILVFFLMLKSSSKYYESNLPIVYSLLALFSVLRFDIGNDYFLHMNWINQTVSYFSTGNSLWDSSYWFKEPTFFIFIYIFQILKYPYIWVIGIYSLISIYFIYKTFSRYDIHTNGIVLIFVSGLLFVLWDQLRQGAALSIGLYALKYIEEDNFKKYSLHILFAFLIHYSAAILLPFYFFARLKPVKTIYIGIIIYLSVSNFAYSNFDWLYYNLISFTPYYQPELTSHVLRQIISDDYQIRLFFYGILWSTVIYYLPEKRKVLINGLFIGAVIFLLASGALNPMRLSFYFIFTMVISIPLLLKEYKNDWKKLNIIRILVFGLFLIFIHDVYTNTNTRGCVPYNWIFSANIF